MLPLIENTRGVKVPWFICKILSLYVVFFLFIYNMALLQGFAATTIDIKILGWCPVGPVLPHREKMFL